MKSISFLKKLAVLSLILSVGLPLISCDDNDDDGTGKAVCPEGRIFIPSKVSNSDQTITFKYEEDLRLNTISVKEGTGTRSILLTYDGNGRISSYKNELTASETSFLYSNDSVHVEERHETESGEPAYYRYSYVTDDKDRATKLINEARTDSTMFEYDNQGRYSRVTRKYNDNEESVSFRYDSNTSLTSILNMPQWLRYHLGSEAGFEFYFWSAVSNIQELDYTFADGSTEKQNMAYVYNECNFPLLIRFTKTDKDGEKQEYRLNVEYYGIMDK